ncbi:hypothetical protein ACQKIM_27445, partial [Lysinibacillus sp. NPDC047702]
MGLFPFQGAVTDTDIINENITTGAKDIITDLKWLENEINKFKKSEKRKWILIGETYYEGEQDILKRERLVIGKGGV